MLRDTDTLLPPPVPRTLTAIAPQSRLWVVCSPDPTRQYAGLDAGQFVSAVLGRSKTATWSIDDGWLSREHFRLTAVDGAAVGTGPWELVDLDTRNGTWINGERIQRGLVRAGDVVRAGATVFVMGPGVAPEDDLGFLGRSAHAAELRQQIRILSQSDRPVHITGESGAGKEVLAEAIHRASGRKGPFLAVNSASLNQNLAESQLFGHRRGAFSGADKDALGAFDAAAGGTLLLDEIGELDVGLQAKLLRVVEVGEVHRLGDPRPHPVEVRLITATHRNIERQMQTGQFREDLYWRIAHTKVEVLPLRERRMDVMPLVDRVLTLAGVPTLAEVARAQGRAAWQAAEVVERYLTYLWPGNMRELRDEASRLAERMKLQRSAAASSPLPALQEALSTRLLGQGVREAVVAGAVVDGPDEVHAQAPNGRARTVSQARDAGSITATYQRPTQAEIDRYEALLHDRPALLQAIRAEAQGNIRAFAEKAAFVLGRQPDTVRRHVYRVLGDALQSMRGAR
ncbi:MAG: sigma 54-interacting transcriptional regulator [Deltaproteobacteria bacterium]|nr:sigma 54-interacting transcriptional regulator [Deltaproteobacteria bacterium]